MKKRSYASSRGSSASKDLRRLASVAVNDEPSNQKRKKAKSVVKAIEEEDAEVMEAIILHKKNDDDDTDNSYHIRTGRHGSVSSSREPPHYTDRNGTYPSSSSALTRSLGNRLDVGTIVYTDVFKEAGVIVEIFPK